MWRRITIHSTGTSPDGARGGPAATWGAVWAPTMRLRPQCTNRLHRSGNAQDVDHALQVVCEHVKTHFGADVGQPARQEVRRTHPVLERSEDVFDGASTQRHGLGLLIQAPLHRIEHPLVLPARDSSIVAGG